MELKKNDIVDWSFIGSGGPGWKVGEVRCKVVYDEINGEVGLEPLDWEKFAQLCDKSRDLGCVEFLDIYKMGFIECCYSDDCRLVYHPTPEYP